MPVKQVEVDYYWTDAEVGQVFTVKAPPEMKPLTGLIEEFGWCIVGQVDTARRSVEVERRFVMLGYNYRDASSVCIEEDEELRFVGMVAALKKPKEEKASSVFRKSRDQYALFEVVKISI
jgi:hypothetical protein